MSNKRSKRDHAFQRPYNLTENLNGCVTNLDSTVKSLSSIANMLKQVNKETIRQGVATRCEHTHELVTTFDIESARSEVAIDIIPECEQLLNKAQIQLDQLQAEEAELTKRVEEQERSLKEMKKINIAQQQQLQQRQQQQQQPKRRRLEPTHTTHPNEAHVQARKKELLEAIAQQGEANKVLQEEIDKIKAFNNDMTNRKVDLEPLQVVERREKELQGELADLEKLVAEKQNEVAEKKKEQKSTEQENSDNDTLDIQGMYANKSAMIHQVLTFKLITESIAQYSSHLEFIRNALHELNQPEFAATTTTIQNCILQCKKYLQALQKEKIYIQMDDKQKQELSGIEQIKLLCKNELPFTLGKTTSKVLHLVLTNDYKVSAERLLKVSISANSQFFF